jgi:hypothetical protein
MAKIEKKQAVGAPAKPATSGIKQPVALVDDPNGDAVNALVEKLGMNGIGKTLFDHNRYSTLATLIALVLFVVVKGYQPRTKDPFFPKYSATIAQIQAEHDSYVQQCQNDIAASKKRVDDMKPRVQDAAKKLVDQEKQAGGFIASLLAIAAPFTGPFAPVVLAAAGVITAGFAADGARKSAIAQAAVGAATDAGAPNPADAQAALLNAAGQLAQAIANIK